jgi:hypothetical protein
MLIWDLILPKLLFNTKPCPPAFHDLISIKKALGLFPSKRHKINWMDTALKKPITCFFRKHPEDTNSKFL